MDTNHSPPQGLWLPLVTPFRDGELDEASLKRLARITRTSQSTGLSSPRRPAKACASMIKRSRGSFRSSAQRLMRSESALPLYLGISGSDTRKVVKALAQTASWPIDGYLIACPYYTRPSQQGLFQHFSWLADSTTKPIIIYNIPHRTGVNLGNETMLRLAERPNIVGVKDCCADAAQSFDLLRYRPKGFSVLVGEDPLFYSALAQGADGGITASAHVHTRAFATIRNKLNAGDRTGALADWNALADLPRLLFAEPSPAPVKHWLWRSGLIDSPELRLPMVPVTPEIARRIDSAVAASKPQ